MSPKSKIVINPIAGVGNNTKRLWTQIESILKSGGLSFDHEYTQGRGHALDIAARAVKEGYDHIVAVGGDGTIHEVANGVLSTTTDGSVTLGVISTGTGNDFIKTVGIPKDYREACGVILGSTRRVIDVGLVEFTGKNGQRESRFFVNGAGVGFDAEVADGSKRVPRFMGSTVPFVLALIKIFPFYRNKDMKLDVDGLVSNKRLLSLVVSNGSFFGGGMRIAPFASLNDGRLDVVALGDVGKLELLRVFPRVYKGTHVTHKKVSVEKARVVKVDCAKPILLQADGEILGYGPVAIQVIPQALLLAV